MSRAIRRLLSDEMVAYLVSLATRTSCGVSDRLIDRAVRWAEVPRVEPGQTGLLLSALVLPRFEPSGDAASAIQTDIDGSTNHSATWGVCHPEGDVRWRFDGELLDVPRDFARICRAARRISLDVATGFGGSNFAAWSILSVLEECSLSGVPIEVRIGFAASAHATLACLCPGRRLIRRDGEIVLHQRVGLVVGDVGSLAASGRDSPSATMN